MLFTFSQNLLNPAGSEVPTILCIDDFPQALTFRKTLLEIKGYDVLTAPDGPSGIEIARSHSVDAVVLDYNMPGMMGDEVAVILKAEHPNVPIVVLTGYPTGVPETMLRISDGFVQKGESAIVLLTAIEKALHKLQKKERNAG